MLTCGRVGTLLLFSFCAEIEATATGDGAVGPPFTNDGTACVDDITLTGFTPTGAFTAEEHVMLLKLLFAFATTLKSRVLPAERPPELPMRPTGVDVGDDWSLPAERPNGGVAGADNVPPEGPVETTR